MRRLRVWTFLNVFIDMQPCLACSFFAIVSLGAISGYIFRLECAIRTVKIQFRCTKTVLRHEGHGCLQNQALKFKPISDNVCPFFARVEPPCVQRMHRSACATCEGVSSRKGQRTSKPNQTKNQPPQNKRTKPQVGKETSGSHAGQTKSETSQRFTLGFTLCTHAESPCSFCCWLSPKNAQADLCIFCMNGGSTRCKKNWVWGRKPCWPCTKCTVHTA